MSSVSDRENEHNSRSAEDRQLGRTINWGGVAPDYTDEADDGPCYRVPGPDDTVLGSIGEPISPPESMAQSEGAALPPDGMPAEVGLPETNHVQDPSDQLPRTQDSNGDIIEPAGLLEIMVEQVEAEDGTCRPRMSTFGDTRNDPFSRDELRLMLAYLLRCSDVATVAAESLPEGHLPVQVNEQHAALLWNAYRTTRERAGSHPPLELVRIEALRAVGQQFRDESLVEAVRAEVDDIYSYVRQLPESTFADPSAGLALIRLFLTERWLRDELWLAGHDQGEINWTHLQEIRDRIGRLEHASPGASRSLRDRWGDYEAGLARYRGRTLIGIATGWPQFDRLTLGLRGVVLLTSRPGVGKSSYFAHAMLGAVRNNPNVCGVYVTLEMDRETIEQRIHAHLAELPLPTVLSGSPELWGRDGGPAAEPYFTSADQNRLDRAQRLIDEFGARLMVLGRQDLGTTVSVEAIRSRVDQFKRASGAESAVIVLDYLSLLDVPPDMDRSEREADRWRITQARRIVENSQSAAYPEGDALLVICESRKPANSSESEWGEGLEDYMGSARLTYAADMALNFRSLTQQELDLRYGDIVRGGKKQILATLERDHVAPLVVKITKARGASRGEVVYEYRFHEYRFIEKPHLSAEEQQRRQAARDAEVEQTVRGRVKDLVVAALRTAGEHGMSQNEIKANIVPSVRQAKIRGYDLQCCLDELVQGQIADRFVGRNSNRTGKEHPRWRLLSDPNQPVARPARRESGANSASTNSSRQRRRRGVE